MHNSEDFDLRNAVNALQACYRAPVERRRGTSHLLIFHPRAGAKTPDFEVYFRNSDAITIVDGTKFVFTCPEGESAYRSFSNWELLDANEHLSWLKSPSYADMVESEVELLPKYRVALTRIVLAALYGSIIQRSREKILPYRSAHQKSEKAGSAPMIR